MTHHQVPYLFLQIQLHSIRCSIVARTGGSHPPDRGSIPRTGTFHQTFSLDQNFPPKERMVGIKEREISKTVHAMLVCNNRRTAPMKPKLDNQEISVVRAWFWPAFLIAFTTLSTVTIPLIVYDYDASLMKFWDEVTVEDALAKIRLPTWEAAAVFMMWTLVQGLLLQLVPGDKIFGPPTPAGERPEYIDNGMKCWFITHIGWLVLGPLTGIINFGALYDIWGSLIATTNALAFPFCIFLMWKGKNYPSSRDAVWTGRVAFDFFQGIELHPRIMGINVKQLLNCRVSMMGWSVAQLAFAQAQYDRGQLTSGIVVCAALHVLYLAKFFYWESGYFASIDIIHDRCGYYIIWGVLVWVPVVYCCPGFSNVERPTQWSNATAAAVFIAGVVSLIVNYVADYQRQLTRATNGDCLIWGKKPVCIEAEYTTTCGTTRKSLLLCSGFWGTSRHFNYIPELCLAMCWSLPAITLRALPAIYWLFLFFLLVDRAERDDVKCREKYGKYWKEYCKRVPYQIIPGVY